ncbi:hypothetical protein J5J10_03570 [Ciceribacter sp. L1K23]|uniref:hypothetical protein n=1 Tax=Ciceribacter sp. L1K23 TaxID=2820276 RepID=UPI001B838172|nr:hypothetical protein [Ciceribacter sp. L1K23]MBR0554748.1 hypothetical protein [Ciceribacter sp. L1K23]
MRTIILPIIVAFSVVTISLQTSAVAQQKASVQSETQVAANVQAVQDFLPATPVEIGVTPVPIPENRMNVRRVGPRFYPDPGGALDLRRDL